jgi:catechol 2,3-dioxygenase-like lactoylglutathione lyase family enzyme
MRTTHGLHHVNIETCKLEETRQFYEDVVGLKVGPRPRLSLPGYWMYHDINPVLHLIEIPENEGVPPGRLNRIDHWASLAEGYDETVEFVKSKGYMYREADIGDDHLKRLFIKDPNGATIELAFLMDKATGQELKQKPEDWYIGAKLYELDEAEKQKLDAFKAETNQSAKERVPAE